MATRKFTWSYSALGSWEKCPRQYWFAYHTDQPRAPNIYRDTGIAHHEKCETFFNKPRAKKVPVELKPLTDYLLKVKSLGAQAELKVCFDRRWHECAYEDRWGVAKVDLHWLSEGGTYLTVVDLKTGKVRDYSDQGRIYLGGLLARYPDVTRGHAEFAYSKTGEVVSGEGRGKPRPHTVQQIIGFQRELSARVKRMEADKKFPAKPGAACRWCDFSKLKGGPCDRG